MVKGEGLCWMKLISLFDLTQFEGNPLAVYNYNMSARALYQNISKFVESELGAGSNASIYCYYQSDMCLHVEDVITFSSCMSHESIISHLTAAGATQDYIFLD